MIRSSKSITWLSITGGGDQEAVNETIVKVLAEGLQQNVSVKTLCFHKVRIATTLTRPFFEALSKSKSVKCLNLTQNVLGVDDCEAIVKYFHVNQTIKKVELSYCKIGESELQSICESLKWNKTLTWFKLRSCAIDGVEMTAPIGNMLKFNTTLKKLYLTCVDPYFEQLSEGLKMNSTLAELSLAFCGVQPADGDALEEAMRLNKGLTDLCLEREYNTSHPVWQATELSEF